MAANPFQPIQFVFCDLSPDALLWVQSVSAALPPRGPAFLPAPVTNTGAPFAFPTPHRASLELPALIVPRAPVPPDVLEGSELAPVAIVHSRSVPQPQQQQPELMSALLQCKSSSGTPTVPPLPSAVPCVIETGTGSGMPADSVAFKRLEMELHSLSLKLSAHLHADTMTGTKYQAIYNNYIKW